jgi:hypothetical protein
MISYNKIFDITHTQLALTDYLFPLVLPMSTNGKTNSTIKAPNISSKGLYHDISKRFYIVCEIKESSQINDQHTIRYNNISCHHLPHKIPVPPSTFYAELMPSCTETRTVTRDLQHLFTFIKY